MKGVGAGSLRNVITVRRQAVNDDESAPSWTTVGTMRASIKPARVSETEREGAVRVLGQYSFLVYTKAVAALAFTEADQIVWNSSVWNVREIRQPITANPFCEIIADRGVTQ